MKNLLKKLHIMPSQSAEDSEGSSSSKGNSNRLSDFSSDESLLQSQSQSQSHHSSEDKPFSGVPGRLHSARNRRCPSPPSSLNIKPGKRTEVSDSVSSAALDALRHDSSSSIPRDLEVEEEYQIQLALELSAREDPEAVQIEAVKQISLGSCALENTRAEVIAYQYWNYNALGYDDKILDGFYDLYGILVGSTMPSLVDLQATSVTENITWEAVLVNKAADAKLLRLEQKALDMVMKARSESPNSVGNDLVKKLAVLVSDHMGGPVGYPESMLIAWRGLSYKLKATLGSMVLPLGSLKVGLARHRALLFKVLADSVGIPCRLVKGQQYTSSSDVAMSFVKIGDGREYIVDLMADPGTLIPSDTAASRLDYEESFFSSSPWSKDEDTSRIASSISGASSTGEQSYIGTLEKRTRIRDNDVAAEEPDEGGPRMPSSGLVRQLKADGSLRLSKSDPSNVKKEVVHEIPERATYPCLLTRSPSWTEGISSENPQLARKMKVKDVSQYMIDAAKENPQLAQKFHDVLLESGVVAPKDLFSEIYQEQATLMTMKDKPSIQEKEENKRRGGTKKSKSQGDHGLVRFLPPLPYHSGYFKESPSEQSDQSLDLNVSSKSEVTPVKYDRNVPVAAAAAAAAAAAVVASSMVVAASRTSDSNIDLPVAAAATATAAAVVATTAAVGKQYENLETSAHAQGGFAATFNATDCARTDGDAGENGEGERKSDKSAGSTRFESALDDVADCEVSWEDITLGERIGLGSYGEVYRGDWHGTEVAVKKFLDQAITVEFLQEFRSEVQIMRKVRHPNVVLFMGAITRAPNLSIVTEFLPRGSLYRLIHRPNNQLDLRRRLRMALDAARGMNYLHNCTPVIVHRDLKSPNLLVDKNWVVKVCDFGLSRMKHSTFLSSRSTAGTAEWMAPEVLRNEPSDEKCDVYSFGVILWELCTLQQPWGGMNPMQVVGAVGFQHRRLDIPDDIDPVVSDIIRSCWKTDPRLRPSFAEIMGALKPLQKPIASSSRG